MKGSCHEQNGKRAFISLPTQNECKFIVQQAKRMKGRCNYIYYIYIYIYIYYIYLKEKDKVIRVKREINKWGRKVEYILTLFGKRSQKLRWLVAWLVLRYVKTFSCCVKNWRTEICYECRINIMNYAYQIRNVVGWFLCLMACQCS